MLLYRNAEAIVDNVVSSLSITPRRDDVITGEGVIKAVLEQEGLDMSGFSRRFVIFRKIAKSKTFFERLHKDIPTPPKRFSPPSFMYEPRSVHYAIERKEGNCVVLGCAYTGTSAMSENQIIELIPINMQQVCIFNGKVYITEEFQEFLNTRQIVIFEPITEQRVATCESYASRTDVYFDASYVDVLKDEAGVFAKVDKRVMVHTYLYWSSLKKGKKKLFAEIMATEVLWRYMITDHSYLDSVDKPSSIKSLDKFLRQAPELHRFFTKTGFPDQITLKKELSDAAEKYSKLVWGLVDETFFVDGALHLSTLEDKIAEYFKQLRNPLFDVALPEIHIDGVEVRELITKEELIIEGKRMHHCVGGYGNRVAKGSCRIFSLRDRNTGETSTLEVGIMPSSPYIVFVNTQNMGKTNSTPSKTLLIAGNRLVLGLNQAQVRYSGLFPNGIKTGLESSTGTDFGNLIPF